MGGRTRDRGTRLDALDGACRPGGRARSRGRRASRRRRGSGGRTHPVLVCTAMRVSSCRALTVSGLESSEGCCRHSPSTESRRGHRGRRCRCRRRDRRCREAPRCSPRRCRPPPRVGPQTGALDRLSLRCGSISAAPRSVVCLCSVSVTSVTSCFFFDRFLPTGCCAVASWAPRPAATPQASPRRCRGA